MWHNSNGRDGEMNQTFPRPSAEQFPIEFKQKAGFSGCKLTEILEY